MPYTGVIFGHTHMVPSSKVRLHTSETSQVVFHCFRLYRPYAIIARLSVRRSCEILYLDAHLDILFQMPKDHRFS